MAHRLAAFVAIAALSVVSSLAGCSDDDPTAVGANPPADTPPPAPAPMPVPATGGDLVLAAVARSLAPAPVSGATIVCDDAPGLALPISLAEARLQVGDVAYDLRAAVSLQAAVHQDLLAAGADTLHLRYVTDAAQPGEPSGVELDVRRGGALEALRLFTPAAVRGCVPIGALVLPAAVHAAPASERLTALYAIPGGGADQWLDCTFGPPNATIAPQRYRARVDGVTVTIDARDVGTLPQRWTFSLTPVDAYNALYVLADRSTAFTGTAHLGTRSRTSVLQPDGMLQELVETRQVAATERMRCVAVAG